MAYGPQLTKNWTITPNLRHAYVSLVDMSAWCMYQNKAAMVAAGWTVKFSSDGTTGPASGADTTDRWTSAAACVTRGATTGTAQSWIVLQNVDGVQIRLAFTGATDDVFGIHFSPTGVYTLQATTTFAPTATDEVTATGTTNSIVGATTSGDRVMTIWCRNDTRAWTFAAFRAGAGLGIHGVEEITSYCGGSVFAVPYICYRYLNPARFSATAMTGPQGTYPSTGAGTAGAAGFWGTVARVFTAGAFSIQRQVMRLSSVSWSVNVALDTTQATTNVFNSNSPSYQAGSIPLIPALFHGQKAANNDGILGSPIDWWEAPTGNLGTPTMGDMIPGYDPADTPGVTAVRTNWIIALGATMCRPWRDAAVSLQQT